MDEINNYFTPFINVGAGSSWEAVPSFNQWQISKDPGSHSKDFSNIGVINGFGKKFNFGTNSFSQEAFKPKLSINMPTLDEKKVYDYNLGKSIYSAAPNVANIFGYNGPSKTKGSAQLQEKSKTDYSQLASTAIQAVDPLIKLLGGKEATKMSDTSNTLSFIGDLGTNPSLIAATGGLSLIPKALDIANKYIGPTLQSSDTDKIYGAGRGIELENSGKYGFIDSIFKNSKYQKDKSRNESIQTRNIAKGFAAQISRDQQLLSQNSNKLFENQNKLSGGLGTKAISMKKGGTINPSNLRGLVKKAKRGTSLHYITKFENGGKFNLIPEGALHARKHNLPEEIAEKVTDKGIPVISYDNGGEIKQHAEIELNEIIFNIETTRTIEDYFKQYNNSESESEKNRIATECGKFLTSEILENTDDRTGLLNTVE